MRRLIKVSLEKKFENKRKEVLVSVEGSYCLVILLCKMALAVVLPLWMLNGVFSRKAQDAEMRNTRLYTMPRRHPTM